MKKQRQSGYYWVKHKHGKNWEIACYFPSERAWKFYLFIDTWLHDEDFSEIEEQEIIHK